MSVQIAAYTYLQIDRVETRRKKSLVVSQTFGERETARDTGSKKGRIVLQPAKAIGRAGEAGRD